MKRKPEIQCDVGTSNLKFRELYFNVHVTHT
jgi:hypothetical protein